MLGASRAILDSVHIQLFAADEEHYQTTLKLVRSELATDEFDAAWAEGQSLGFDAADDATAEVVPAIEHALGATS
jgi:hypothetical protein